MSGSNDNRFLMSAATIMFFTIGIFALMQSRLQQPTIAPNERVYTLTEVQKLIKRALAESNCQGRNYLEEEKIPVPIEVKEHEEEEPEPKKLEEGHEKVQNEEPEPEEEEKEEEEEEVAEIPKLKKYSLAQQLPELQGIAENDPKFKEALEKYSINNTIILSLCNIAFQDMLTNWRCTLDQLGIKNYMNIAMDATLHEASVKAGINSYFPSGAEYSSKQFKFGSQGFKNFVKMKSAYVLSALNLGYDVLLSDNDIVFFKDPFPYLYSFGPQWDLITQSDHRGNNDSYFGSSVNSGFYFVRSNKRSRQFFLQFVMAEQHPKAANATEQAVLNSILRHSTTYPIAIRVLRRELFPNGFAIWGGGGLKKGQMSRKLDRLASESEEPYIAHANWMRGKDKKRRTLQLEGWWVINGNLQCVKKIKQPILPFRYITEPEREEELVHERLRTMYGEDYKQKLSFV